MTEDDVVWLVAPSIEDDRPVIEFDAPANRGIDWARLDAVLQGERPLADCPEVGVVVQAPDALAWGFYSVPGTLGLISAALVEHIGPSAFRLFHLLPAKLNDAVYFFLKPVETLPCLDLARSEVAYFRSNPSHVKAITKYAFTKSMISDPLFSIPELPRLFATPPVRDSVIRSGIPGVRFTAVG